MRFSLNTTEFVRYSDGSRHPVSKVYEDIRVRAVPGFRDEVQRASFRATKVGFESAKANAPFGGPSQGEHLRDHIGMSRSAVYAPGGLGGGGSWQTRLYIDTYRVPHAAYLFTGTGLYGPKKQRIQYGKQIRFFWWRELRAMKVDSIRGMHPDRVWWDEAIAALELDLGRRLNRIYARGINNANVAR